MNFVLVYGFRSSHWHLPDLSHSYWTDKHLGRAAILNKINFASLIPTNAAIHRLLAPKSLLFEFGLRRAQGHNAVTASKYAVLGGFDYTSNCVAAKLHKLPLAGSTSKSLKRFGKNSTNSRKNPKFFTSENRSRGLENWLLFSVFFMLPCIRQENLSFSSTPTTHSIPG